MNSRGKLVVLEGIDGAGKGTQTALLCAALEARGIAFARFGFPHYESSFGRLIAQFLNGEFGKLDQVDAHFSALLYAGDRFEAKAQLEAALGSGKLAIADRYTASNLAHQTARVAPEKRATFLVWLEGLEYGIYGLPVEDLVIYLRVEPAAAQELVSRKKGRGYTTLKRDLQEADLNHLKQAAAVYDRLAKRINWVTIECYDAAAGALRAPEEIHRDVLGALEAHVLARPATS
jgi:dTMP kinase